MSSQMVALMVALVLLFPLAGSILNGLVGPMAGRSYVNTVGPLAVLGAFGIAVWALVAVLGQPDNARAVTVPLWTWLDLGQGNLQVGADFTVDPLSVVMMLVITGVGFLIHVYSVGYMAHDEDVARFFSYMNFFIFSMLVLVLAGNLVILVIGWALVALSSYLLIGFWYQRPSAVVAARKAFVTQVIGDIALVLAAFMIFIKVATTPGNNPVNTPTADPLRLDVIFAHAQSTFPSGGAYITGICVLLAIGAFAKSAQFPLHTWLPDAMEGPTPVSALIHAATMVTAGVYLIARFHPLFNLAPVAQDIVACVGMGTALMAGIIALSQVDIKRVIAYSTMSQIGLMIFAVGIGAYSAGLFHFVTHAVFKALLFMAAGNVIHALHDEQDIRLMGGLRNRMKWTTLVFVAGSLALAGFPFVSGWWSKEGLLGFGVSNGGLVLFLYAIGLLINILTGLYAFRLFGTVFSGEPQTARVYAAHEAPKVMLVPVLILAVGALGLGAIEAPIPGGWHVFSGFLQSLFPPDAPGAAVEPSDGAALIALAFGSVASLIGIGAAISLWVKRSPDSARWFNMVPRRLAILSFHKFYFDELYDALLVKPTAAFARAMRRVVEPRAMDGWVGGVGTTVSDLGDFTSDLQTGLIRDYASWILGVVLLGIAATVFWLAK